MANFVMPKLGADMTAGTLVAWHKQPGDTVKRGDVIAEVETEKGVIDVEVFTSGTIDKLVVPLFEKVPVGTVLAVIREEGAAEAAVPVPSPISVAPPPVAATAVPVPPRPANLQRLRMSPSARALARKLSVDASLIKGTGPAGAITREDIEQAAAAKVSPPAAVQAPIAEDRAARMRKTIAAAMSRSKREIPHYYLSTTIDMDRSMAWLAAENLKRPVTVRLLHGVLLIKAVALALKQVPELNAVWDGDQVRRCEGIHVGVAISLRQGGLLAPAIHDTNMLSLSELMAKFRDLVERARTGSLRSSELSDPTITVTSLGEQGVESAFGIIYPPQVAIVGFGKVSLRPWCVAGQVVARQLVTATLSADHRVTDGHRGSLFLSAMDRLLQEPEKL